MTDLRRKIVNLLVTRVELIVDAVVGEMLQKLRLSQQMQASGMPRDTRPLDNLNQ